MSFSPPGCTPFIPTTALPSKTAGSTSPTEPFSPPSARPASPAEPAELRLVQRVPVMAFNAGPESQLGLHGSDLQTSLTLVTAAVQGLRGQAGVVVTRGSGRRSEGR